jgi:hypothetical protein
MALGRRYLQQNCGAPGRLSTVQGSHTWPGVLLKNVPGGLIKYCRKGVSRVWYWIHGNQLCSL